MKEKLRLKVQKMAAFGSFEINEVSEHHQLRLLPINEGQASI